MTSFSRTVMAGILAISLGVSQAQAGVGGGGMSNDGDDNGALIGALVIGVIALIIAANSKSRQTEPVIIQDEYAPAKGPVLQKF